MVAFCSPSVNASTRRVRTVVAAEVAAVVEVAAAALVGNLVLNSDTLAIMEALCKEASIITFF